MRAAAEGREAGAAGVWLRASCRAIRASPEVSSQARTLAARRPAPPASKSQGVPHGRRAVPRVAREGNAALGRAVFPRPGSRYPLPEPISSQWRPSSSRITSAARWFAGSSSRAPRSSDSCRRLIICDNGCGAHLFDEAHLLRSSRVVPKPARQVLRAITISQWPGIRGRSPRRRAMYALRKVVWVTSSASAGSLTTPGRSGRRPSMLPIQPLERFVRFGRGSPDTRHNASTYRHRREF